MREPGDLRAGFLYLKDEDSDTLYLAQQPGSHAFVLGTHIPNEVMNAQGVLFVKFLLSKEDFLAGERRDLGKGILVPYHGGIRLHSPEDPRKSTLNIWLIRSIIEAEVWVHLVFRREG